MCDDLEKIITVHAPVPVQEIIFTINPMGPSMIERLKQKCEQAKLSKVPEGMSAASLIVMANEARMKEESERRISAIKGSEDRLFDPG